MDDARLMDLTATARDSEVMFNIVVLAIAVLLFARLARVEIGTWRLLRDTRDQTDLGEAIKPKKLWYGIMTGSLAVLYALSLLDAVGWYDPGIWPRLAVRTVTLTAVYLAARWGDAFYAALQQEAAHPTRGRIMDATDG